MDTSLAYAALMLGDDNISAESLTKVLKAAGITVHASVAQKFADLAAEKSLDSLLGNISCAGPAAGGAGPAAGGAAAPAEEAKKEEEEEEDDDMGFGLFD
eukprot:NODE_2891_length_486_cov_69.654596_g2841_i0.p2 GENE.NODE_2891_length_486_cov_69.654596_g2841_i0~~NODE_2891_length_486_cov_69.654596_g2841_i0.p2  ORF type:complete len:100 (+),score=35.93 NODE_2891_length_486_cov_69.654596_g2841_i0:78-377(+)